MVFPARIADPDIGAGVDPPQQIGADLESAGAAERLHRDHAALLERGAVGAEQDFLDRAVVGLEPVDRAGSCGARGRGKLLLGAAHAFEHRHFAVVVGVDADAEVDFVGVGVGVEGFGDAQDRVVRRHFDGGEKGCAHVDSSDQS